MAVITIIKVQCDRCQKIIPVDEGRHSIIWRDVGRNAEYDTLMSADLCCDCYNEIIKKRLAPYSHSDGEMRNKEEEG